METRIGPSRAQGQQDENGKEDSDLRLYQRDVLEEAQQLPELFPGRWWRDLRVPEESIPGVQETADVRRWVVPVPANGKVELPATFLTPW